MLALDFILICLTSACILYSMLLNKRIQQIQKYRTEMLKLFREFDKSVQKAEEILQKTQNIIPESHEIITSLDKRTENKLTELELMHDKADKLAEELETIIISGNKLLLRLKDNIQNDSKEESLQDNNQNSSTDKNKLSQIDYYQKLANKKMA